MKPSTSSDPLFELAIIGGGIVGLAVAMEWSARSDSPALLLEAERDLASHQTGHNSGVIHSGLYYAPHSAKAQNCVEGRDALYGFCEEQGIPFERCGKLVVASSASELPALDRLEERGRANGLVGMRRLRAEELGEYEPEVSGAAGLWVPQTGIVDFGQVAAAYARIAGERDVTLLRGAGVRSVRSVGGEFRFQTDAGEFRARHLISCAGLQSDRIARLCGLDPGVLIIPFRGEYHELAPARRELVRGLIYPVPDPRFPFLGVHFTRRIDGSIEAGPNAVLALARHGYSWGEISGRDLGEMLAYRGFWRMAARYWKTGLGEVHRSLQAGAFVRALQKLLPALQPEDLVRGGAGVRAMAVEPNGLLVDDFRFAQGERMIHVLNAPSPAATASIAIARTVVGMAMRSFGIRGR